MEKGRVFMAVMVATLIFLSVAMLTGILSSDCITKAADRWSLSIDPPTGASSYAPKYVVDDSYLYTADGKTIYCLGSEGVRWGLIPPDPSTIMEYYDRWNILNAASAGGQSYIVVYPGSQDAPGFQGMLIAASDDGRLLWTRPLDTMVRTAVAASGDMVYLHSDNNVTVLDKNNKVVSQIDGIYYIPAVDEKGHMYVLRDAAGGHRLEAYGPDGTLSWQHALSEYATGSLDGYIHQNPAYHNGTLYVWLQRGIIGMDVNGTLKWSRDYDDKYLYRMGFAPDSSGYVYISHMNDIGSPSGCYVTITGPDGDETIVRENASRIGWANAIWDGVAYALDYGGPTALVGTDGPDLDSFIDRWIAAYDVRTGELLWRYDIPSNRTNSIVLNETNIYSVLGGEAAEALNANKVPPEVWYANAGVPAGTIEIKGKSWLQVYPGKDAVYVSYWADNYEYPPFFGKSNCTYTGGLFALDKNGSLLWSQQTDAYITGVSERNGTVYFHTNDGKFSAATTSIAAGIAAASVYLILRIFILGAVSRAKARLDKNVNRVKILEYIRETPGSTLHEIAKGVRINVGTIRYHLLILSINHKIVSHDDGTKFVRYFSNSGALSDEEKLIIGLCRRKPVVKILAAMAGAPGLTNLEIAGLLGIHDSAASRSLKELVARGVVKKIPDGSGRLAYAIDEKYRPVVSGVLAGTGAGTSGWNCRTDSAAAAKDE